MKVTICFLISFALFAAEAPKVVTDSVPVSAEHKAAYWRAVAEAEAADAQSKTKHDAVTTSVTSLRDECSAMNPPRVLSQDQSGEPVCVSKPASANNK